MWQGGPPPVPHQHPPVVYGRAAYRPAPPPHPIDGFPRGQQPSRGLPGYHPPVRPGGPRGGRRGGHRPFGRPHDTLQNLPIPPGALSDPWESLNARHGGPQPLEAPTEEILAELRREVSRQLRLQEMTGQREAPLQKESSNDDECSPTEAKAKPPQSDCEDEPPTGSDTTPSLSAPEEAACAPEVPHARYHRPLVLPPPSLDGEPRGEEGMGISSSSSNAPNSGGERLSFLASIPTAGRRGFQLPAITGGASEGHQEATVLSLDEEGIKKRLRLNSEVPRNDPT